MAKRKVTVLRTSQQLQRAIKPVRYRDGEPLPARLKPGRYRAFKLVGDEGEPCLKHHGARASYAIGGRFRSSSINTSNVDCAQGLNVGTLAWCKENGYWVDWGHLLVVEFDIPQEHVVPVSYRGIVAGKFRVRNFKVIYEANPSMTGRRGRSRLLNKPKRGRVTV